MYIVVHVCIPIYMRACMQECTHECMQECTHDGRMHAGKGRQDTRIWAGCLLGSFLEPLSDCPSVACSAARTVVMPHPAFACTSCAHSMERIVAAVCDWSGCPGCMLRYRQSPADMLLLHAEKAPCLLSPT